MVTFPDVLGPVLILAFAVGINAFVVLQWRGRLPRGHPDDRHQRAYLLFPLTIAWLAIAIVLLGTYVGIDVIGRVAGPVFLASLLIGVLGLIVWMWQPQWLRPGWQKEMIAEGERRGEGRVEAARRGGRYVLDVVVDGRVEPLPAAFDDLEAAERAARSALSAFAKRAKRGTKVYATILDRRDETAVRLVEQP